jgi:hypothetical protein
MAARSEAASKFGRLGESLDLQEGKGVAVMELGSENRNLVDLESPSTSKTKTDADIVPIV